MLGFVGAFLRYANIGGLLGRQLGELGVQLLQLQTGNLLVQMFREW